MTSTQNLRKGNTVDFHSRSGWSAGLVLAADGRTVTVDTYQGSFTVPANSDKIRRPVR
jgi:hypothetical protein